MYKAPTATTEQIKALRDESAGDPDIISICDAALAGDVGAIEMCSTVIDEMKDDQ